jgi:hypothetical protein
MQRLIQDLIAILPAGMLAGLLSIGLVKARMENTPPQSSQNTPAPDNNQYKLAASIGSKAPFTIQYEGHLTIRADLTATAVETKRINILTPSVIQSLSQQQLQFIEGMVNLYSIEAFTEKPDGRRIPVDPTNIITRDAASGLQATYVRDLKQRIIIFPDVGVGDTLVMTNKEEILQDIFPGEITYGDTFPRSQSVTSAYVTVEAPAAVDLQVKATGTGVTHSVELSGDIRRHTITIVPDGYQPEEPGAVSPFDRDPSILVSTFKSYQELGSAYGNGAFPKAAVTPEIASLANEITKNIDDRRAQAVAIDAWVKKNIRYVAVLLTLGRVVPHDAATVLKNKFGDCKDKVTLMSALLAAKGIGSEAVLINLGNTYTLPEPPTLAVLNHVILYLPEFDLYDDPTVSWAPFGVLAPESYDKPVVRVSADASKFAHTPIMNPEDHTAHASTIINVTADGTVIGQTEESNTGIFGGVSRIAGGFVQTVGEELSAQRQLQSLNTPGTGRFDLGKSAEPVDPAVIKGSFTLHERFKPPGEGGNAAIPVGMPLTARPGIFLLGNRLNGRKSAFVCYAGRQTEDISVTFDRALPMPIPWPPTSIDNPYFGYRSMFKIEGRTFKIHREFVSRVSRQSCPAELEAQIAADMKTVGIDREYGYKFVSLTAPKAVELTRVATAGQILRLASLMSLNFDCSSMGFATVRVVEQPQHGKITVDHGKGYSNFRQGDLRYECNKRQTDSVDIAYESDSGFTGTDSVTVDAVYASGWAAKWHYSIKINPKDGVVSAAPASPPQSTSPMPPQVEAKATLASPAEPQPISPTPPQVEARLAPTSPAQSGLPTSPNVLAFTLAAAAGQSLRVAFLYDLNPDCSQIGFATVRIIDKPKHGRMSVEKGTGFSTFPQNNPRYDCNKRRSNGVVISYKPNSGYIGPESITVDVIYPDGGARRRHYSIDVK